MGLIMILQIEIQYMAIMSSGRIKRTGNVIFVVSERGKAIVTSSLRDHIYTIEPDQEKTEVVIEIVF